jgi:hypothetical protein
MSRSEFVYLEDCMVIEVREKSMKIVYDDEEIWLPLSTVEDPDKFEAGDGPITVGIREWKAIDLGIEVD